MCRETDDKQIDEIKKTFMKEHTEHGIGCGLEIAKVAKDIHPHAMAIIPLYRSCIVIEQSEEDKKEGSATMHTYADPHWLGGEITVENLNSDRFHSEFYIQGDRQGPAIINKNYKEE